MAARVGSGSASVFGASVPVAGWLAVFDHMESTGMSWNDERVELLKKLWSEGLSASQIASRLGNITRNAVIGKVHRLGLAGRATTSRMKSHRPRPRPNTMINAAAATKRVARPRFNVPPGANFKPQFQADAEPYSPPVEEIVIPLAERKSVLDLLENHCRWPIGDPQHADFHFCGHGKVPGTPYCEFHGRRAFQPPQPRRRDREIVVTPATYPQAEPTQEAASTPASAKQSKSAEPAKS